MESCIHYFKVKMCRKIFYYLVSFNITIFRLCGSCKVEDSCSTLAEIKSLILWFFFNIMMATHLRTCAYYSGLPQSLWLRKIWNSLYWRSIVLNFIYVSVFRCQRNGHDLVVISGFILDQIIVPFFSIRRRSLVVQFLRIK